MTGQRWVRLDTSFPTNPKVLDLLAAGRHRALAVYLLGLAYAGQHGTEGHIPSTALGVLGARRADVDHLLAVELWHSNGSGWEIHDWHDYQPSNDTERELSKARRSAAAKHAATIRWHGPPDATTHAQ